MRNEEARQKNEYVAVTCYAYFHTSVVIYLYIRDHYGPCLLSAGSS
jgi:hypothetical protein